MVTRAVATTEVMSLIFLGFFVLVVIILFHTYLIVVLFHSLICMYFEVVTVVKIFCFFYLFGCIVLY